MITIKTNRLGFSPLNAELIEAAMTSQEAFESISHFNLPYNFVDDIYRNRVFPIRLQKVIQNPERAKWYGFIVELNTNTIIGTMGFKAQPDHNGLVEIGYGIHQDYRGKGYATEMANALIRWAFNQPNVKGITATNVLKTNMASIKILEKIGMSIVNEHEITLDLIIYK